LACRGPAARVSKVFATSPSHPPLTPRPYLPILTREAIVAKVAPQVMTLAQHKYASNVVEACLKHGGQAHRDAILE
jgi:hypothetical protein